MISQPDRLQDLTELSDDDEEDDAAPGACTAVLVTDPLHLANDQW